MNAAPSRNERRRCELRADQMVAALHLELVAVEHDRDVVIAIDGAPAPWVLPHDRAEWALAVIGGAALARDVATFAADLERGHIALVLVIGEWVQVTSIGLRPLQKGGAA